MSDQKPNIVAYLKPWCGWSNGVRAIMDKYSLEYEDRDIINDPVQRMEMIQKSGQELSPCVEINGHMLPDVSGEEVEAWMIENKVVTPNDAETAVPTNSACTDEEHERMAAGMPPQVGTIEFIAPDQEKEG
ncbi:MAG: glutaredoxin [Verrucomicrobiota bacterium]